MDNVVPLEMNAEADTPYCIWHPSIPSISTLRELANRYPRMLYQIGRTCAAAGENYINLYRELQILPDVHIAEEAREAENIAIYEDIMTQPTRYDVMNDYERTVYSTSSLRGGALLNGDTAARRSLDAKQRIGYPDIPEDESGKEEIELALALSPGFQHNTFDITEDMNIDEYETESNPCLNLEHCKVQPSEDIMSILSQPLPQNLPTVDKDLIILLAAYHGDIDRYSRLRRPKFIAKELPCVVRGIYHNTLFALWWFRQDQSKIPTRIFKAVLARMIMNNVIHPSVCHARDWHLPYLIWYPSVAKESTYRELYRLQPSMAPQILRSCLAGGQKYLSLFKDILKSVQPDRAVVKDTELTGGLFQDAMTERLLELGGKTKDLPAAEYWKLCQRQAMEIVRNGLPRPRGVLYRNSTVGIETDFATLYDGLQANSGLFDMVACMPDEWRDKPEDVFELNYIDWPTHE